MATRVGWVPLTTSILNLEAAINDVLYAFDVLVSPIINSRSTVTPPGSPVEGDVYIVPLAGVTNWAQPVNTLVGYYGGIWRSFGVPNRSHVLYVADESNARIRYDLGTSAWVLFP